MLLGLVEVKARPCRHGRCLQSIGTVHSLTFYGQLSNVLVEQLTLHNQESVGSVCVGGGGREKGVAERAKWFTG